MNDPNNDTWNVHFEDKRTFTLAPPVYADTIASEVKTNSEVYFDRFMESGDITFTMPNLPNAVSSSGSGLQAKISLIGENVVNEDPNAVPVVRMIIKSEIPANDLPPAASNNYVYRHTLRLKNEDEWDQDDLVVACEVDSKDPTRHGVA